MTGATVSGAARACAAHATLVGSILDLPVALTDEERRRITLLRDHTIALPISLGPALDSPLGVQELTRALVVNLVEARAILAGARRRDQSAGR